MKLALLMICAFALAYNPESCPVVLVKGQNGEPLRINKDDYDANPEAWELFDDTTITPAEAPAPAPADSVPPPPLTAPTPSAPVQMVVSKIGRGADTKYYVTDMAKNKIVGVEGIDESGYADEGSAWAAVTAVMTAKG